MIKSFLLLILIISCLESPGLHPDIGEATYLGEFRFTAYCPCSLCCYKNDTITASGVKAREGITIASDWNVIPLNTWIKILLDDSNDYIYRKVEDCGISIKGNWLDIYFLDHWIATCFGIQYGEVWIEKYKGQKR